MTASFCKAGELEWYRRLGLNQRPRSYEPRALPLRHPGEGCSCLVSLELWQPASVKLANWNGYRRYVSIIRPQGYEPRALPLRHDGEGLLQCLDAPMRFVIIYRQPVSIGWPRSYEPRALPLRHAGEGLLRFTSSLTSGNYLPRTPPYLRWGCCSSALMHQCDLWLDTGDRFRSCDLGVMSPALFL